MAKNTKQEPNTEQDPNVVDASPTKNLFISILVRDISIRDAIGDLLDNSVDGALRLRPKRSYSGLWVKIELDAQNDKFVIEDNCGGIDAETARKYIFRFGHPDDAELLENSVGVFGIGMKRALFRLGKIFSVESTAKNSSFRIDVDVTKWQKKPEWSFEFADLHEDLKKENPIKKRGTKITVTGLHKDVKSLFEIQTDVNDLVKELQREHLYSIDCGLNVSVNGFTLEAPELIFKASSNLKPFYWEKLDGPVEVRIYAGIAEKDEDGIDGGWYVFCNKRLVLGPDHTAITGWGATKPTRIPKYHAQFYHFRGYAFLDAKDPLALPWNTAKTGMDTDSPIYRSVLQQMIILTRSVIDFLNKLHQEETAYSNEEIDETPLKDVVNKTRTMTLSSVQNQQVKYVSTEKFVYPEKTAQPLEPKPVLVVIRYAVPKSKLEPVQKYFESSDTSTIGLETFNYFYDREIAE